MSLVETNDICYINSKLAHIQISCEIDRNQKFNTKEGNRGESHY